MCVYGRVSAHSTLSHVPSICDIMFIMIDQCCYIAHRHCEVGCLGNYFVLWGGSLSQPTPIEMDLNVGQFTHTELSGQLFQMPDHGSKFRSGQEMEEEQH